MKKIIIKVISFITIFIIILSTLNSIFVYKSGHRKKIYQGLYTEKENYDVLLLGSSHMNGGINPNILWNEYGVTSFNYATGGQPIDVTYYLLEEALKTQNPEVVVLDAYYLGLTETYGEEGYIRYVLDSMKFSSNKIKAVLNSTPEDEWIYYLAPFFKYHSRWKEISEEDYIIDYEDGYYAKGFGASQARYGNENMTLLTGTDEYINLPEKTEIYLNKFIKLSNEKNFNLILVNMPYDYTSTNGMNNWISNHEMIFNTVKKIASDNNIPFINYNDILDEINFDFPKDMYNIGHLNVYGSAKVTKNLGEYLYSNYNIEDKRNDSAYNSWNLDYDEFIETEKNKYLESISN